MLEVLSPGMQHAEKPDVGSQMLRVASQFEQRRCAGAEEQIVEQPLVLQHKRGEFMRQGEDDMEVRARATAPPSAPPATWRVRSPGTWGSAGCGTSCTRWPDVRSGRTDRDDRPEPPCGSGRWRRAPCDAARARCDPCRSQKLLPAARRMSATSRVGRLIASSRLLERFTASGRTTSIASSGLGTACR